MTQSKDNEWLAQNAQHAGTDKWEGSRGAAWDAARNNLADYDVEPTNNLGGFYVAADETFQVLLVKDGGKYAGACTCPAFENSGSRCSHLCAVRLAEWQDTVSVPSSHDYVRELIATTERSETEDTTVEETDDPSPPAEAGGFEKASEVPKEPEQSDDAFANPLPEVDDKYAISMNGETYIRKAGYARLLSQQGWTVETEEVVGSHETEWTRAKYQARIFDEGGRQIATSVGTAGPAEKEDMADADMHLDELAETRAWTRAASIATGEGMTAMAEIPEHADKEVQDV